MKTLAHREDTQEIVRRLGALRPGSERRWGRMSAHQMVCHVGDAFRMALGEKAVTPASGLLQSTIVKWIALYVPRPWPSGLDTVPEIDQVLQQPLPCGEFASDLRDAITLLGRMAALRGHRWPRHPIFGRMSEADWLRWGYLHTDHHLRQFGE